MGCHLTLPPFEVDPYADKLQPLLLAILALNMGTQASPLGVAAVLGVAQWFCLLSRPHYSIFDKIYGFARVTPEHEKMRIPSQVLAELLSFLP